MFATAWLDNIPTPLSLYNVVMNKTSSARLAAIAFAIIFPTLVTWVYFHVLADSHPRVQQMAYSAGKLLQFAFPIFWVLRYRRQQLAKAGLPGIDQPTAQKLTQKQSVIFGLVMGVLVAGLMFVIYRFVFPESVLLPLSHELSERIKGFSVDTLGKYVGLAAFYAVIHSFMEEYYFRWFVFGQLRHVTKLVPAIIISGLAFMAHHVIVLGHYFGGLTPWTIILSLCIAIGGMLWAWQYEASKSLLGPWLSHLIVDAGIFLIGYDLVF